MPIPRNDLVSSYVSSTKADKFYLFLDRHLFGSQPVKATLEEIRRHFGFGSDVFQGAMILKHATFRQIKDTSEMQVAFAQWQRFLSIAYGRFDASEPIFLIHSYLSVLAKIMAYQVISGERDIPEETIRTILDGDAFRRLNIANFTENDFYRWTDQKNENLTTAFRMIADELSGFQRH